MIIRPEEPTDYAAIRSLITAAFAQAKHKSGTEAAIVVALREAKALSLSLVAVGNDGELLGHVAFSPATIDGESDGWFVLGPVAVLPDRQGKGIGASLIRAGLEQLRAAGARGCVLVGEPAYYGRFGFRAHPQLRMPEVPPVYFQALAFQGEVPAGVVAHHEAFGVEG